MKIDVRQMSFLHENMRQVLLSIEHELGLEFTITNFRQYFQTPRSNSSREGTWRNEDGVHGQLPLRAVDLRCRDAAIGSAIESWINDRWVYDSEVLMKYPGLPGIITYVALFHEGTKPHLHIQVHTNTRRRPIKEIEE